MLCKMVRLRQKVFEADIGDGWEAVKGGGLVKVRSEEGGMLSDLTGVLFEEAFKRTFRLNKE